ncbi:MAG: heavy metal-associated domain-containing protein [Rubrobacter sp.]
MNARPSGEPVAKTRRVVVSIHGLGRDGGGSLAVERALSKLPGVAQAYVNSATEMAYVEYDPLLTGSERLIRPIEREGFRAGRPEVR